jgi:hypothetical protein
MILRYRPDDGPAVEFDFRPGDLESPDAEALEDVGGSAWTTFEEFEAMFFRGHQRARRALLWMFLRRTKPSLKFADLRYRLEQIDVDYSDGERARILEVMLADPNLDDETRTNLAGIVGEALVSETEAALDEAGVKVDHGGPKDQPELSESDASTSPQPA